MKVGAVLLVLVTLSAVSGLVATSLVIGQKTVRSVAVK